MKTTIKENVKQLLIEKPITRDKEALLFSIYYSKYCDLYPHKTISIFFLYLNRKEIPSPETLKRLSRQLQEQNPELRGKEWEKRQRKVKKVQKELGYNVEN